MDARVHMSQIDTLFMCWEQFDYLNAIQEYDIEIFLFA